MPPIVSLLRVCIGALLLSTIIISCGGGGGGGGGSSFQPVAVNDIYPSQIQELRTTFTQRDDSAKISTITTFNAETRTEVEQQLNTLFGRTVSPEEVDTFLRIIRSPPIQKDCNDKNQRFVSNACVDCGTNEELNGNECIPTVASCNEKNQIRNSSNQCVSCGTGQGYASNACNACTNTQIRVAGSGGGFVCMACGVNMESTADRIACIPTVASCHASNQIRNSSNVCESCPANQESHSATNTCIPTVASCNTQNQIRSSTTNQCINCPSGGFDDSDNTCKACVAGLEVVGRVCMATMNSCNNNSQRFVSNACVDCGANEELNGNECIPTVASCNMKNQIRDDNNACVDCGNGEGYASNACNACTNTQIRVGSGGGFVCMACGANMESTADRIACIPTVASCHASNQIRNSSNVCESCPTNQESHSATNTCIPTVASCNTQNQIRSSTTNQCINCPSGGFDDNDNTCKACVAGLEVVGRICMATMNSCNTNNQRFVSNACVDCGTNEELNGNECIPTVASCNEKNQIRNSSHVCVNCPNGEEFHDMSKTCIPTVASCNAKEQIRKNNQCQPCLGDNPVRSGNNCVPATEEINQTLPAPNPSNNINYRTREYTRNYGLGNIGAHFAYQRGYWGQGVTVAVIDSAIDEDHVDLAANVVGVYDSKANVERITASQSHGTAVAGIIAAARNSQLIHGVAPSTKIYGIHAIGPNGGGSQVIFNAWQYASTVGVHIINNSYGRSNHSIATYNGRQYYVELPLWGREKIVRPSGTQTQYSFFRTEKALIERIFTNKDLVMVWAHGNDSWHIGGSINMCLTSNITGLDQNNRPICRTVNAKLPIADFIASVTIPATSYALNITGTTWRSNPIYDFNNDIKVTDSSFYTYAPHESPQVRDQWLGVVATDHNNMIASFSNGCGDTKYWCLAAPGQFNRHIVNNNNTGLGQGSGTSYAAPHVSGALALLKSRLPSMSMSIIRAILLTTATDLPGPGGANDGIDDIYGWGLVNIERAITLQGNVFLPFGAAGAPPTNTNTETTTNNNGVRLVDAHIDLPDTFAHLTNKLSAVSVAVSVVADAYYNADLSHLARIQVQPQRRTFGNAANEILNQPQTYNQSGAWFSATDSNGKAQQVGAQIDLSDIGLDFAGTWQLRHQFCEDCQESVWHEWNQWQPIGTDIAAHENIAPPIVDIPTPFFARRGDFALVQSGDGLSPFITHSGKLDSKDNNPYQQFGLRWQKHFIADNQLRLNIAASASHIDEQNSIWGADFSPLVIDNNIDTQTQQGKIMIRGNYGDNWRGFASIEEARAATYESSGGMLGGIRNLRARGWSGGIERRSILQGGDLLRLSARRETQITNGQAIIHHRIAEGSFSDAFYRNIENIPEHLKGEGQQLHDKTSTIDLQDETRDIYAIGYILSPFENEFYRSILAVGLEYDTKGKTAASAQWQIDF